MSGETILIVDDRRENIVFLAELMSFDPGTDEDPCAQESAP